MWTVDGSVLHLTARRYNGTFTVTGAEPIMPGVYAKDAVLTITAKGAATHPTSHFTAWTTGVAGDAATNAAVTVTMDGDKTFAADFDPDEWLYDPGTKLISDGE